MAGISLGIAPTTWNIGGHMPDIASRFKSLRIDGYAVDGLFIKPKAKFSLEISNLDPVRDVSTDYELLFLGVHDCAIKVQGRPWFGRITALHAHTDVSGFLKRQNRQDPTLTEDANLVHFVLDFELGSFEILAEDFAFSILQRFDLFHPSKLN